MSATPSVVVPRYLDYASANSVYDTFPALMADGRPIPGCGDCSRADRAAVIADSGVASNWEYRRRMMADGVALARRNFEVACAQAGYVTPAAAAGPARYLDSGRIAAPTDLKEIYMSRQELAAQKATPSFVFPA
jgi:hypothetical protein